MFKNMVMYRIAAQWQGDLVAVEQALQQALFSPCSATQEASDGWVPPRGEAHGALVESIGGQWLLRFHSESKILPASVVQQRVQDKCSAIERESGRKPGKKEQRDLKEEARLDLLPQAFTKQSSVWVWIDPQAHLLVVDASAQTKADAVVSSLVEHVPGLALALIDTRTSPQAAMAQWLLTHEAPAEFSIDQSCELKASDDSKAVVRYTRHPLDIDEVRTHIAHGKLPTQLAMTWQGRVSFVLTEALQLKKIIFQEPVQSEGQDEGGLDADMAIATGELRLLVPDLLAALDGEGRSLGLEAMENTTAAPPTAPAKTPPRQGKDTTTTNITTGPGQAPVDTAPNDAPF